MSQRASGTEMPPGVRYVERQEQLAQLASDLAGEKLVAVDTEAASFHRYFDKIYLIQISTAQWTAIVDPVPLSDLTPVGTLLADDKVEVVFHDADYDLRLFHQQLGFKAQKLFDTRIAAQLLGEPAVGLAALLERYRDVKLDKRFQRADWSARPLSPGMIAYAAEDTAHLTALRHILHDKLEAAGRLTWAQEEFRLLEAVEWNPKQEDGEAYLKLKGAKRLKPRGRAVLRELHRWRERTARRADRAQFRVMNNQTLVELAEKPPANLERLKRFRGVGNDAWRRWGKSIMAALERGMNVDPSTVALPERPRSRKPDADTEQRLIKLKARRNEIASRLGLEPGVTCPNGTLEAIAREQPADQGAMSKLPGVRQWQVKEFGAELIGVMGNG